MAYTQVKQFNPSKMGKKKGWCLQNTRLGFGITSGKYSSAKADMLAQKKAGTLHPFNTIPQDCSVPVYVDTTATAEHVEVYHRGAWYSDGVWVGAPNPSKVFGWGELCDGVRVVKATNSPSTASFFPSRGYWRLGDTDARVGRLASFMRKTFPSYTPASALGNYYGANLQKAIKEFQRRTGLQADGNTGPITYNKLKSFGFGG